MHANHLRCSFHSVGPLHLLYPDRYACHPFCPRLPINLLTCCTATPKLHLHELSLKVKEGCTTLSESCRQPRLGGMLSPVGGLQRGIAGWQGTRWASRELLVDPTSVYTTREVSEPWYLSILLPALPYPSFSVWAGPRVWFVDDLFPKKKGSRHSVSRKRDRSLVCTGFKRAENT